MKRLVEEIEDRMKEWDANEVQAATLTSRAAAEQDRLSHEWERSKQANSKLREENERLESDLRDYQVGFIEVEHQKEPTRSPTTERA